MSENTRMGNGGKGGVVKTTLGDTGLPKPKDNPALKHMPQKGILSKSGNGGGSLAVNNGAGASYSNGNPGGLSAGDAPKRPTLKGFDNGGKVQP